VLFPGNPTVHPPDVDKRQDGSVKSTTRLVDFMGNGFYCGSATTDYNFAVDANAELQADQDNFLKSIHGTLGTSERGEFLSGSEKLPELIFTVDVPQEGWQGKAIVLIKGNRAYMLVSLFRKGLDYTAEMGRFLDSLEIESATR
jgi:hypothetical protein